MSTGISGIRKYKRLLDKDGQWVVGNDVLRSYYDFKGPLTIGSSAEKNSVGPELAFGWEAGDYLENNLFLIKFAPGGTSLTGRWRPPSSGKASGKNGELERGHAAGDEYDGMIAGVKDPGHTVAGFHGHSVWRERWTKIMGGVPRVTTEPADRRPREEQWKKSDVIAFFHDNPVWAATKAQDVDAFLVRG